MGNFDRGGRSGGRSFGGRNFGGGNDRRGGFGDRRGGDRRGFGGGDRPMHKAICSNCGKECEVPFRPTSGKPVYCSDCFEKTGNDRGGSSPARSNYQSSSSDQNKNQFETLNAKLEAMNVKIEKIMNILEPKTAKEVTLTPVVEKSKETKVAKPKKEAKKPTSEEKE